MFPVYLSYGIRKKNPVKSSCKMQNLDMNILSKISLFSKCFYSKSCSSSQICNSITSRTVFSKSHFNAWPELFCTKLDCKIRSFDQWWQILFHESQLKWNQWITQTCKQLHWVILNSKSWKLILIKEANDIGYVSAAMMISAWQGGLSYREPVTALRCTGLAEPIRS